MEEENQEVPSLLRREAGGLKGADGGDGFLATFVLSNAQIDRYGDSIDPKGWELDNYRKSPVVLFGHDATDVKNVVGRMEDIHLEGGDLVGTVRFLDEGDNPNADIVRKLVQKGFLKAVSVGFRPLDAKPASDPKRKNGWDFRKQELLEVSIVPVPALPSALAKSAEAGIDMRQLVKAGWLPEAKPDPIKLKGFWEISWLAELLNELCWCDGCIEEDSAGKPKLLEGLQALGQALVDMSMEELACLMDAAGCCGDSGSPEGTMEMAAPNPLKMALGFLKMARTDSYAVHMLDSARKAHEQGKKVQFSVEKGEKLGLVKAGRVLSKENENVLMDVKSVLTDACGKVEKVLAQVAESAVPSEVETEACDPKEDKEYRDRLALAARLRASAMK